jgi:hypothetical protein
LVELEEEGREVGLSPRLVVGKKERNYLSGLLALLLLKVPT